MSDSEQPDWMKGFVPHLPQQGHRWVKGQSGNPRGRPPGRVDARTKITRALMDDGPAIARVVIEAAKEGDLQACGIVLSRIAPPIKAQSERVEFYFEPTASISRQIESVLATIASGALSADVGREVIAAIGTLSSARAVEELESRIITLEARQV